MARQEPTSYEPTIPHTGDYMKDMLAADKAVNQERAAAIYNYSETGSIVGAIYRAPFADSYAQYRVTKARPFTVQHVAVGDAWHLPQAHVRGLNAQDVKDQLDSDIAWATLANERI